MAVPGCFDATPAYAGKRGVAAYRRQIQLHDDTPHRLIFGSVHQWCRVFVNGAALGDHAGGFTQFHVDITDQPASQAELIVLVDNQFNFQRSPLHLDYFDWYHYGGITRAVELHRLGTQWVNSVRVVTEDITTRRISVKIDYTTLRPGTEVALLIHCDNQLAVQEKLVLTEPNGQLQRTFELPDAQLWSPQAPNLYLLKVFLGDDDLITRIGIRQIAVRDQQILINDQPVRLLGFNRHEAHPQFGHALPDGLLVSDIQQLLDMGCNFVRGSHYPQDPRFLDLCDEAGICVWNESIGWQHTEEHLTNPHFMDAQVKHTEEMVAMSYNHPSVILWGVLNESESHKPTCRPAYERLINTLHQQDPTRPVTYACHRPTEDICFDLADVISVNTYPGWYIEEIDNIPAVLDSITTFIDGKGFSNKPFIISEIGAGAVPGWRDWNESRWTEQYQAQLLEVVIRHLFVDRTRACGLAIWLYNDFRTSEETRRILGRARGYNDKGVVDEYRRPKLSYATVRQQYSALKPGPDDSET